MARPKKHENGSEQIQARIPIELKHKVFKAIEERPGLSISDVVIEALTLHGRIAVDLPDILKRRAEVRASEHGITLDQLIEIALRDALDGKPQPGQSFESYARQVQPQVEPIQPKAVVAAAMSEAPFGKSVTELLEAKPKAVEVPMLENEEPESWSEVFARAKAQGEFGEEYFGEQVQVAGITRWPQGFRTWPVPKQVAWMDEKHPRKAK